MQQQGNKLNRFTEAHTIRQTSAKSELFKKSQPRNTLQLIWSQLAMKRLRHFDVSERDILGESAQCIFDPTLGFNIQYRQTHLGGTLAQTNPQSFAERHIFVCVLFLEESDGSFDLLRAQFDPLAAYFDERLFQVDQVLEFSGGERGVAYRDLPVIIHDAVEAHETCVCRCPDFGFDFQFNAYFCSRLLPPGWDEDAEATLF